MSTSNWGQPSWKFYPPYINRNRIQDNQGQWQTKDQLTKYIHDRQTEIQNKLESLAEAAGFITQPDHYCREEDPPYKLTNLLSVKGFIAIATFLKSGSIAVPWPTIKTMDLIIDMRADFGGYYEKSERKEIEEANRKHKNFVECFKETRRLAVGAFNKAKKKQKAQAKRSVYTCGTQGTSGGRGGDGRGPARKGQENGGWIWRKK